MTLTALGLMSLLTMAGPTADDLLRDDTGAIAGFEPLFHTKTRHDPDQIIFGFKAQSGIAVELTLRPGEANEDALIPAGPYKAQVVVRSGDTQTPDAIQSAIRVILDRIAQRGERGPVLHATRVTQRSANSRGPPDAAAHLPSAHKRLDAAEQTGDIELWLCFGLLFLSLLVLPWTLGLSWTLLARDAPHIGARSSHALLALLVFTIGWVGIFEIPRQLVTVFAGYGTVVEAWALRPVVKYGAASTALYGPALKLFGPSTDVLIVINLTLGLLTPLLGGVLARRLSGSWFGGMFGLILVGLLPALMRDRATESILVPWSFWMLAALVHVDRLARGGRWYDKAGVIAFGALALHGRPEAWVVAPILFLAFLWGAGDERKVSPSTALMTLGSMTVAAAPRLWSLIFYTQDAQRSGDVPGLSEWSVEALVDRFIHLNALWTPDVFPISASVCALAAVLCCRPGSRVTVACWVTVTLLWQGLSTLDLPPVSMPRTQAPAMIWASILAATSLGWLASGARLRLAVALGLLTFITVPSSGTIERLWQPTNAQRFDAFWDRMIDTVEDDDRDRCVVALDMSDPPRDSVIRLYPMYELAERSGRLEVFSISTFTELPARVLDGHCDPLYLEGPQCRARFFGFDQPAPEEAEELPLCRRMQTEFHLLPLAVDDVENAGNADFPFYGASKTLRYGLYRIGGLARHPPQVPGADVR